MHYINTFRKKSFVLNFWSRKATFLILLQKHLFKWKTLSPGSKFQKYMHSFFYEIDVMLTKFAKRFSIIFYVTFNWEIFI